MLAIIAGVVAMAIVATSAPEFFKAAKIAFVAGIPIFLIWSLIPPKSINFHPNPPPPNPPDPSPQPAKLPPQPPHPLVASAAKSLPRPNGAN
ncbi:hypothetical protein V2O64_20710 [Verrucomicrobiaceae bacterium 227]